MHSKKLFIRGWRIAWIVLLAAAWSMAGAQAKPGLTGVWQQDNDRCQPKRKGDVQLRIAEDGETLTVETTIAGSGRHAVQKYRFGGQVSQSTGADGDAFYTSVVRKEANLVFTIEEHEDGRILRSHETWSLIEEGASLERVRNRENGEKQTLVYRRMPAPDPDAHKSLRNEVSDEDSGD